MTFPSLLTTTSALVLLGLSAQAQTENTELNDIIKMLDPGSVQEQTADPLLEDPEDVILEDTFSNTLSRPEGAPVPDTPLGDTLDALTSDPGTARPMSDAGQMMDESLASVPADPRAEILPSNDAPAKTVVGITVLMPSEDEMGPIVAAYQRDSLVHFVIETPSAFITVPQTQIGWAQNVAYYQGPAQLVLYTPQAGDEMIASDGTLLPDAAAAASGQPQILEQRPGQASDSQAQPLVLSAEPDSQIPETAPEASIEAGEVPGAQSVLVDPQTGLATRVTARPMLTDGNDIPLEDAVEALEEQQTPAEKEALEESLNELHEDLIEADPDAPQTPPVQ